ncbi:hypothetical protein XANCAGTX0491_009045 [Xanthoria calcicola]
MDPSNQIQQLGHLEYRRKNYHAALNFFNSVISTEKRLDVSVLDCRAATYEKLGDLHAALKDGRRMISDYKADCAVRFFAQTGSIHGYSLISQGLSEDWQDTSVAGQRYCCFRDL